MPVSSDVILDKLFPANCDASLLAGLPHPKVCKLCLNNEHPVFDKPKKIKKSFEAEG